MDVSLKRNHGLQTGRRKANRLLVTVLCVMGCHDVHTYGMGSPCSTSDSCRPPLVCVHEVCVVPSADTSIGGGSALAFASESGGAANVATVPGTQPNVSAASGGVPGATTGTETHASGGDSSTRESGGMSFGGIHSSAAFTAVPPTGGTAGGQMRLATTGGTETMLSGGTSATVQRSTGATGNNVILQGGSGTGGVSAQQVGSSTATTAASTQGGSSTGGTTVTSSTQGGSSTGGTTATWNAQGGSNNAGTSAIAEGGSGMGGTSATTPSLKENGASCAESSECRSTYCVDEVCCDAPCAGQCQTCRTQDSRGQCQIVSTGQPVGNRPSCTHAGQICGGSCTGASDCTYPDARQLCDSTSGCIDAGTYQDGVGCDGAGNCSISIHRQCPSAQVCNINTDNQCGPASYVQADLSAYHMCAVISDGTVRCWGSNYSNQLGYPAERSSIPCTVPGIDSAIAVAAGIDHSCVLKRDRSVQCWGGNSRGELGCAAPTADVGPSRCTPFGPGSPVAELVASEQQTCVRLTNGLIKCWGSNEYGQLGDGKGGSADTFNVTPVTVAGISSAKSVVAGVFHTCAILDNGAVKCWGINVSGQLGTGDTALRTAPASVVGIDGITQSAVKLAATGDHTCALLTDRSVWCFGAGSDGQLGNGELTSMAVPVQAHAPMTAADLAVGGEFTCALLNPQSVRCWGIGRVGALGDGTLTGSPKPVATLLPTGVMFKSIFGKYYHTCALSTEGRLWCWGAGNEGQLGDSRKVDSSTPVEVATVCAP